MKGMYQTVVVLFLGDTSDVKMSDFFLLYFTGASSELNEQLVVTKIYIFMKQR